MKVDVPQEKLDRAIESLDKLKHLLLTEDPGMPEHLSMINADLRQHPELVYLLTDEQIAPLYQSILKVADVQIKVKQSRKSGKKGLLDDGTKPFDVL